MTEKVTITELAVGPDKVFIIGDQVAILSARPMPDWTVREFCVRPIYFQEKKYYLKRKLATEAPYAFRYELAPWTSELGAESKQSIYYDAEYVNARDHQSKLTTGMDHLHSILFVFYPFLGFGWSRLKQRVLSPIGFDPASITEASIILAFGFFLLESLFVVAFRLGFLAVALSCHPLLLVDRILFVLLPIDCVFRYGRVLRGDSYPPGFLEWIFRREKPGVRQD